MKRAAFTLFEVLIVLLISSFVVTATTRFIWQSNRFLNLQNSATSLDRSLSAAFSQIYQDFSCAHLPLLDEPEKRDKKKSIFIASTQDSSLMLGRDKKMLGKINFITTNSILKNSSRLVRVLYELLPKDRKDESKGYRLFRKETEEIDNVLFKEKDGIDKRMPIKKHLILDNIKEGSCEFFKKTFKDGVKKESKSLVWGGEDRKDDTLPEKILLSFVIVDELGKEHSFELFVPIFSKAHEVRTALGEAAGELGGVLGRESIEQILSILKGGK